MVVDNASTDDVVREHFECDLLLTGGRALDPETGLDAVRNVAVTDGVISAITTEYPPARSVLNVSGRVVAPGFIDLHSHGQTVSSLRVQALDGVTTALELEAGASPVAWVYDRAAELGRPINYGYSASWAMARMHVLDAIEPHGAFMAFAESMGRKRWQQPATAQELSAILDRVEEELYSGALGIGVLVGYAPRSGRNEYYRVAKLAAKYSAPTFTHARFKNPEDPESSLEGIAEIVAAAAGTGAHMHLCHINSTSLRAIDEIADVVGGARQHGLNVSTEAYPYGAGMTGIGVPFLHPDNLSNFQIAPHNLVVVGTGERPANARRLLELREQDPGAMVIIHYLDEENVDDWAVLERALLLEGTAIASDAVPFSLPDGRQIEDEWPLPPDAVSHPRSSGTFSRVMGTFVRELGVLSLMEAVKRCTLIPAQVLEDIAPAMRLKGRMQVGADADIVVFDSKLVADRSTYLEPSRTSTGVEHLLVNGEFVVQNSNVLPNAMPGRPVKGRFA